MRVFIAINVPEFVDDALAELQSVLRVGKPVRTERFHLTLVFLDEQPDELIEEAHHSLQHFHLPKFEVRLTGLDTFGGRELKILFAVIEKNEALDFLQEKIIGALRNAGVHLDRKRFRPHVTIARFVRRLSRADRDRLRDFMSGYADFGPVTFMVDSFSLYRSTLSHKGAIHDELAQYKLV